MKIAIIGAGIGGATACYKLSKYKKFDITIFERSKRYGGRIQSEKYEGKIIETGAEFFLESDFALIKIINELGLDYEKYISNRLLYSYKNQKFFEIPLNSRTKLVNFIHLAKYLGVKNALNARKILIYTQEWKNEIELFYEQLENSKLEDLYKLSKFYFKKYWKYTLYEYLTMKGINKNVIEEFVNPIFRAIYNLNADEINAFMGVLSIAAKTKEIYHIKNGNIQLVQEAFKHSKNAKISLRSQVTQIEKTENGYEITFFENKTYKTSHFDFIFAAIPLRAISEIRFKNFSKNEENLINNLKNIKYNHVNHYIIQGKLLKKFKSVFNKADSVFIAHHFNNYISEINLISYKNNIYNVTTNEGFNNVNFLDFFENYKLISKKEYNLAYPYYTPEVIAKIPITNKINETLYLGSDLFVTSMGSSVKLGELISEKILNHTTELMIPNEN